MKNKVHEITYYVYLLLLLRLFIEKSYLFFGYEVFGRLSLKNSWGVGRTRSLST